MTKTFLALGFAGLFLSGSLSPAKAEDVLWNLNFKNLAPGAPIAEAPFVPPSANPQKVTVDADNKLVGAKSVSTLASPLQFTKATTAHYTPAMTLLSDTPVTAGVITITFDLVMDQLSPSASHPVETLMAFPFLNDKGATDFLLVVGCSSPDSLFFNSLGAGKNQTAVKFKPGEVVHVKAVLDLNKQTFQAFLNDTPLGDPVQDSQKFSAFKGFTIRDGTALGGNYGETFTAGIGNITVTKS
jgi:hypothetical protein